jgi:hypothetical protein
LGFRAGGADLSELYWMSDVRIGGGVGRSRDPARAYAPVGAHASVVATGPRRGCRLVRVRGPTADVDAVVVGRLCAQVEGYNLQAATRLGASDREGLEPMARYLARPPIATGGSAIGLLATTVSQAQTSCHCQLEIVRIGGTVYFGLDLSQSPPVPYPFQ